MSPCTSIQLRREMYIYRYALPIWKIVPSGKQLLTPYLLWRLDHAADEEARRIMLGVSR